MTTTTIIPGLVVDETLFEAAADGITTHLPDLAPLSWETFTASTGWTLVPDEHGDAYKAELVLRNTIESTVKINLWTLPDRRGGEQPKPHSHPWEFTSRILLGGYTEDRYDTAGDLVSTELNAVHRSPSANHVPRSLYHEVTEIHEPSRTLTLMICQRGERGTWGYLDVDRGCHVPNEPDPLFLDRLRALNPHQQ